MKTLRIISVLIITAALINAQDANLSKTIPVGKGTRLDVSLNPGNIIIKTGKDDEVIMSAQGIDKEEFDEIEIHERDNRVSIRFDADWGSSNSIKFTFIVPTSLHLQLQTSGGDIELKDNLLGEVSVRTSGGDVAVGTVQGRLQVNTSGGDISVTKSVGDMTLNTSGGDIDVGEIFGENAGITTMGGDISIEYSEASLNAKTFGGDIKIGDVGGNATAVTMGGDIELQNVSGSVLMETYGGDLTLLSASGKVSADTKGGDIKLYQVKGNLSAKTSGGEIYAELYPLDEGETYLKSSGGDIELRLPESSKVSIDAEIRLRGSRKRQSKNYSIASDFLTKPVNSSKGDKEITAEYSLNGGGQKIIIETINSNIRINKLK
jgi:DUF4097 and DUF4098 domain-containing protein YvlB